MRSTGPGVLTLLLMLVTSSARAEEALVAVAANFVAAAVAIETEFEARSDYSIKLAVGSTGKLYAQIINGAPFDVLLAADAERPLRLEEAGYAVPGSRRTYAVGQLVLWSRDDRRLSGDGESVLRAAEFRRLAIANPRLAPYGAAAVEVLKALGTYPLLRDRLVMGENVLQAHTMVASGNAELGLIALSLLTEASRASSGGRWLVPAKLHAPIRQDAVLLENGANNPAAIAFLDFLSTDVATRVTESYGYRVE